jgi:hypothetical protein
VVFVVAAGPSIVDVTAIVRSFPGPAFWRAVASCPFGESGPVHRGLPRPFQSECKWGNLSSAAQPILRRERLVTLPTEERQEPAAGILSGHGNRRAPRVQLSERDLVRNDRCAHTPE